MIGKQIANYRIDEKLGEGGMGVVYKALDLDLDRPVAIKVLSTDLSSDPALLERFRAEAKAQAHFSHANIASLYSFVNIEGHTSIVMEYLEGETLDQILRRRGLVPWEEAIPWFQQALLGVGFAHRMGIVHRDIKPSNIMVNRYGVVKVMDFGIAKAIGGQRLTKTGMQVGTVAYMSPEQVWNRPVDVRTDIYCLGVTLYELLTAHLPFEGDNAFQVMSAHVNTPPPPPISHYPYIPLGIQQCILKALEKDPSARFQSVEEFGEALKYPEGMEEAAASVPTVFATPTPSQPAAPSSAPLPRATPAEPQSQPPQAAPPVRHPPSPSPKGKWILLTGVAGVVALLGVSVYGMTVFGHKLINLRPKPAPVSLAGSGGEAKQAVDPAKSVPASPSVLISLPVESKPESTNEKSLANRPPGVSKPVDSQPAPVASAAPPDDGSAQQTAIPPQPEPVQPAPPPAATSDAQFNDVSETLVKLHARMDAANQSLTTMKQEMAAQGLTLRVDIAAAESRMQSYFQMADRAFQNRDLESAQKNIDWTEQEIAKIEHFLGR